AGLADGWRLCVAARSRRLCRAGDFARRGGPAPPQGFRDDASIVPYGGRARPCRALQDIFAAKRQCTPPSAPSGASTSPCRGGFGGTAAYKASPARGGVAPGDGGVRHLALPIPFRGGANLPGGRERPPYNARHTGGEI